MILLKTPYYSTTATKMEKNAVNNSTAADLTLIVEGMSTLNWIDVVGFVLQGGLSVAGFGLNGFLFWVCCMMHETSNADIVQMNLTVCGMFDAIIGSAIIVASRIILVFDSTNGMRGSNLTFALIFFNINLEDLASILTTILRTRQVITVGKINIVLS